MGCGRGVGSGRIMGVMANQQDTAIESGARQVEEREHMAAGMEGPRDVSAGEREPEAGIEGGPVKTAMGSMRMSMLEHGHGVQVRVGDARNSTEIYEAVFETTDEAYEALLGTGVLRPEQVLDRAKLLGVGVELEGVTAEELGEAGLKRRGGTTF